MYWKESTFPNLPLSRSLLSFRLKPAMCSQNSPKCFSTFVIRSWINLDCVSLKEGVRIYILFGRTSFINAKVTENLEPYHRPELNEGNHSPPRIINIS